MKEDVYNRIQELTSDRGPPAANGSTAPWTYLATAFLKTPVASRVHSQSFTF